MPDNKLTCAEIIHIWSLCQLEDSTVCETCPLGKHYPYCDEILQKETFDLINRLQAENERYKRYYFNHEYDKWEKQIKAEAYKEFADRLKEKKARYNADNFFVIDYIPFKEIDNTLKELVGEDNGNKL